MGLQQRKSPGQRIFYGELQEAVVTTDAMGGSTESWERYANEWLSVDATVIGVSETNATPVFQVAMPYHPGVEDRYKAGTQQRVVAAGYTLKVLAVVNPEQRNRDLVLTCARALTDS